MPPKADWEKCKLKKLQTQKLKSYNVINLNMRFFFVDDKNVEDKEKDEKIVGK